MSNALRSVLQQEAIVINNYANAKMTTTML